MGFGCYVSLIPTLISFFTSSVKSRMEGEVEEERERLTGEGRELDGVRGVVDQIPLLLGLEGTPHRVKLLLLAQRTSMVRAYLRQWQFSFRVQTSVVFVCITSCRGN